MADQDGGKAWSLWAGINRQDVSLVGIGGALGGLLQPIVAKLDPSSPNPELSNWFLGPVLGVAAAGITVFVLANSRTEEKLRLLFFSLLCGLAFPTVLTSAVDSLDPKSQAVEQKAADIADKAAKGESGKAAAELTRTMAQNPSTGSIDQGTERKLEVSAGTVVSDLAEKAGAGAPDSAGAIETLKQIGTTARDAGYDGVALRVTEELKKIEGDSGAATAQQQSAGEAADAVIGVAPGG